MENLPFDAMDEQVRALFGQFGTVETVDLMTDRDNGRPRGFVEMSSGADEAIVALHAKQLNGCSLNVIGSRPCTERASPGLPWRIIMGATNKPSRYGATV